MARLREYSFLGAAFLLAVGGLFGNVLSFLLIPLIVLNACGNLPAWRSNLKKEWICLGMPIAYCLYMLVHFAFFRIVLHNHTQASFATFETMLVFFVTVPLYILSMKPFMTPKLLGRALLWFGWGTFLFNLGLFFMQTGLGLFTHTASTIGEMYMTRFGDNKYDLLGSFSLMLEPQSMTLALAALGTLFLFLTQRKFVTALLTLGLLLFLSFTLTKSAILGFVLGAGVFGCIYIFCKMPRKFRLWIPVCVAVMLLSAIFIAPQGVRTRAQDTRQEIGNVIQGEMTGGSLSPRIEMWRCIYGHFGEFALFGRGLFYGSDVQEWFTALPDSVVHRSNTHNSFIEYWINGGLFGLLLLLMLFIRPIVRMYRRKEWSMLVCAGITLLLATNMTCVLFLHVDSLTILMFWLASYYFYTRDFAALEPDDQRGFDSRYSA